MRLHHSHSSTGRSGITLTEILIAIMILGIGMVSVATLFPIGLMRLRDATRDARSTILAQSAMNDADVRGLPPALGNAKGLVNPDSFVHVNNPWYRPWQDLTQNNPGFSITPLTHDLTLDSNDNLIAPDGVFSTYFSPGLPVAYDPLFWATTHFATVGLTPEQTPGGLNSLRGRLGSEGRFGSGIGFIRNSPDGSQASAHGLQRITNFEAYRTDVPWPYTYSMPSTPIGFESIAEVAGKVFTSLDDPVLLDDESGQSGSPLVPVNYGTVDNFISERKYEFSWMLTGRLGVAGDPSTFEGNIVIYHNRPIGLDPAPSGLDPSVNVLVPTGERVVEAIWGYSNTFPFDSSRVAGVPGGYSSSDDRTVMIRWPVSSPDPLLRVGDFIADVTYERYQNAANIHYPNNYPAAGVPYSGQRIHWYRIVQKGGVEPDPTAPGFLRSIIRVDTPLQAKTRLVQVAGGVDAAVREVALICPYIVNVFPISLYSR